MTRIRGSGAAFRRTEAGVEEKTELGVTTEEKVGEEQVTETF